MKKRRGVDPSFTTVPREPSAAERAKIAGLEGARARRSQRRRRAPRLLLLTLLIALIAGATVVRLGQVGTGPLARLALADESSAVAATATTTTPPGSAPGTTYVIEYKDYRPGDCVLWDQDSQKNERESRIVPCDRPHLMEMTGHVTVEGKDERYPGPPEWDAITTSRCNPLTHDALGYDLDPHGRFFTSALFPTDHGWAQGDRNVWCGIEASFVDPALAGLQPPDVQRARLFVGAVKGQERFWTYRPGQCRRLQDMTPIPCTDPHEVEMVGMIDIAPRASSVPATADDPAWQDLAGDECRRMTDHYLGMAWPADVEYRIDAISPESWAAGARLVPCWVGRPIHSGRTTDDWATTTGSLRPHATA